MRKSIPFYIVLSLICLLLFCLGSCREKTAKTVPNSAEKPAVKKIAVTDDLGRKLEIPAQPKRILALAPSMTEMLFALCPDTVIVGRTQVCNYPELAKKKPVVNTFPMDLEGLLALQPDLIFTEDGITSMETAEKIQALDIPVYFQKYRRVDDVFRGLNDIGRIMHRETAAKKLTDSLKAELNAIENEAKSAKPLRALVLISTDPIYVYGRNTLMTDKLQKAGGDNALQDTFSQLSPALTREYVLKLNPDIIFGQDREQMENSFFKLYPELKQVNAYRNQRLYQLNDDLASRPSPRIVESVREIKKYLYP